MGAPTYDGNGASFTVAKSGDSPTLTSDFYIMFGHVDFVLKAAPGTGIVSSAVLQSDDLDEIDWEWLGGDNNQVQTNYFGKGQTITYDRGAFHPNPGNHDSFHTYSIDWTSSQIVWQIDGNTVRVLTPAQSNNQYPQTPMMIKIGCWAGGDPGNPEGTIEWAGGLTDYSAGPFSMQVKSISVTDYSTGTQYVYTDKSGTWQSIEAVGGQVNGQGTPGSAPSAQSNPPAPSSTSTPRSSEVRPPHSTSTYVTPSVYPWIPDTTTTLNTVPSPISTFAGVPSSWLVTESGSASSPSSASKTHHSSSSSSSSHRVSSSVGGTESSTVQSIESPATIGTPATFVTYSTTVLPGSTNSSVSPSFTVAPSNGGANGHFSVRNGLALVGGLIFAIVL
jgi:hypothetical protein